MLRVAGLLLVLLALVCGACGQSGSTEGSPDGASGCPASEPSPATGVSTVSCFPEGKSCSYGCDGCTCLQGHWYCTAPGCSGYQPCPQAPPLEGSSCAVNGGCCGGGQQSPCFYGSDAGGPLTAACNGTIWQVQVLAEAGVDGGDGGDASESGDGGEAGGD
jgi:hypothetical protein